MGFDVNGVRALFLAVRKVERFQWSGVQGDEHAGRSIGGWNGRWRVGY